MNLNLYLALLLLHILGATIWTGGHIVLATTVLPRALRARRASILLDFEENYERIGMPALGVQIVTGIVLAWRLAGDATQWFAATPLAHVIQLKLACLLGTAALAAHAKARVLPRLNNETLPVMAWHIAGVSALSVLFVAAGAMARLGGFPL